MAGTDASESLEVTEARARIDLASPREGVGSVGEQASLADVAPVALLRADRDGHVAFANAAWQDLCGQGPDDALGHGWLERLSVDAGAMLLALLGQAASDAGVRSSDHQLLVAGGWRWTRWWVNGTDGADCVVKAVADVDQDHAEREALLHRAAHDPLTGLVNRQQFIELTDHALCGHLRHPGHLAVLFVDLDNFKEVNDAHGHARGDRVLLAVSKALATAVRPEDVLARIGGDEFAVMCDRLDERADATAIADRVRGAFGHALVVDDVAWDVSVSVGVAYADGAREAPDAILDRADRAMYDEKRRDTGDPSVPPRC